MIRIFLQNLSIRLRNPSIFVQQVSSTFAVQVILLLVSVINGALIARWFGAEGKGVLQLVLLAPSMLGLFLAGGIGLANVHYLGSKRYDLTTLMANSLWFVLLATLASAIILAIGAWTGWIERLIPGIPLWMIGVSMLGLPMSLLANYWGTLLQGLREIGTLNVVKVAVAIVNLVLALGFVLVSDTGVIGIVLASLVAGLVNVIILERVLHRRGGRYLRRWDGEAMRSMLQFGMRGHVGNILQYFNYRLDFFIVNIFLGASSVGMYSVSTRLAELVWYFPSSVGFVIFPKAASSSSAEMNRFTPRAFRWTLGIAVSGAFVMALLGPLFIRLIYTDSFMDAYRPMLALLPGVVLLGSARVLTNDIAGRGYPQYNSISSAIALILTVVLDLLLIPRFGIMGAALASTASYSMTTLIALLFYRYVSRRSIKDALPAKGTCLAMMQPRKHLCIFAFSPIYRDAACPAPDRISITPLRSDCSRLRTASPGLAKQAGHPLGFYS